MIGDHSGSPAKQDDPDARCCDQCGHVWFAGERHHQYVAADAEHDRSVEVLCSLCLNKRRVARADR
jgi:hypothetical protein